MLDALSKELLKADLEKVLSFSTVFLSEWVDAEKKHFGAEKQPTLYDTDSVRTSLALQFAAAKSGVFATELTGLSFDELERFSTYLRVSFNVSRSRDWQLQRFTVASVARALLNTARRERIGS